MTRAEDAFAVYVAKQIDDRLAEAMVDGSFDAPPPDTGLVRHLTQERGMSAELHQLAHDIATAVEGIAHVDGPYLGPKDDESICEIYVTRGEAEYRLTLEPAAQGIVTEGGDSTKIEARVSEAN